MSVDLPEPEGPMIATNSPLFISNETLSRAFVSISSVLYILVMWEREIIHTHLGIICICLVPLLPVRPNGLNGEDVCVFVFCVEVTVVTEVTIMSFSFTPESISV